MVAFVCKLNGFWHTNDSENSKNYANHVLWCNIFFLGKRILVNNVSIWKAKEKKTNSKHISTIEISFTTSHQNRKIAVNILSQRWTMCVRVNAKNWGFFLFLQLSLSLSLSLCLIRPIILLSFVFFTWLEKCQYFSFPGGGHILTGWEW